MHLLYPATQACSHKGFPPQPCEQEKYSVTQFWQQTFIGRSAFDSVLGKISIPHNTARAANLCQYPFFLFGVMALSSSFKFVS
jgi:hypothetical protein